MINFDKGVQSSLIPKPLSTQDKNKFIQNGVEMVKKHHAIPQKKEGKPADKSPDSKSSASSLDPVQKKYTIQHNEQWRDMKNKKAKTCINFLAENNANFSLRKLCTTRWLINAFKGAKKHAKAATHILEFHGVKVENKMKHFAQID